MKIQYASDLHLEFEENRDFLASNPIKVAGDILVLAGDICPLILQECAGYFWDWCEKHYERVLITPGNHEFYGTDVSDLEELEINVRPNVAYYYNKTVTINETDFFLTPLWTHVPLMAQAVVKTHMVDFRKIFQGEKKISVEDYNALHAKALSYLQNALSNSQAKKKVVVTHHLPSSAVVQPCYRTSLSTYGFAVELGDWIAQSDIDVWVYGHSHFNMDAQLGRTKLLSNQLGYCMRYDEGNLVADSVFEL